MLLLHTCGCASPIQSGPPPSFSRATLAPSASARTEARSHRGYLHIFREQFAVPLDLIRCFPFNGLRRLPRATLLLPGRPAAVALQLLSHRARPPCTSPLCTLCSCSSASCCRTRVRPALSRHSRARTRVFTPPGPTPAPAKPPARARQPRLQRPPRALRSTPVHTANFRTPSRARSRHPLDVAHVSAAPAPVLVRCQFACVAPHQLMLEPFAPTQLRSSCALLPRTHSSCAAQLLLSLLRTPPCACSGRLLPRAALRIQPLPRTRLLQHLLPRRPAPTHGAISHAPVLCSPQSPARA
jgi:hypothetical protein